MELVDVAGTILFGGMQHAAKQIHHRIMVCIEPFCLVALVLGKYSEGLRYTHVCVHELLHFKKHSLHSYLLYTYLVFRIINMSFIHFGNFLQTSYGAVA